MAFTFSGRFLVASCCGCEQSNWTHGREKGRKAQDHESRPTFILKIVKNLWFSSEMEAFISASFSGEELGNKPANNFFAKKACHYHIWG
jgi:hypothetical protein